MHAVHMVSLVLPFDISSLDVVSFRDDAVGMGTYEGYNGFTAYMANRN